MRFVSGWFMTAMATAMLLTGCEPVDSAGPPSTTPANAPATQPGEIGKVTKTDAEWKKILTPNQYFILREKGTEPPFKNEYFDNHEKGTYVCAACALELFNSEDKFESGTGWPSYTRPIAAGHVVVGKDADGQRDELTCARCGGHIGHVFDDGPKPTGKRFCIDSGAMKFLPAK
ncbi:hypothetical protein BH09PLA1_BH09PLA1_15930 [soil metagenome]